jgi:DNA-binding response OmpR family regulator
LIQNIKHVFLVDDDEDDQLFFVEAMQEIDSSIYCSIAENGRKALNRLHALVELPDLIFLDINMPELNGFDCLKELKRCSRLRTIPVIMLSTSVSLRDISYSKELGADLFFTKPSSYSKLCEILKKVFNSL